MSKNINIRMSAERHALVRERAASLRVSESEYAGIIFELGWKNVTNALAELENASEQEESNEANIK